MVARPLSARYQLRDPGRKALGTVKPEIDARSARGIAEWGCDFKQDNDIATIMFGWVAGEDVSRQVQLSGSCSGTLAHLGPTVGRRSIDLDTGQNLPHGQQLGKGTGHHRPLGIIWSCARRRVRSNADACLTIGLNLKGRHSPE